MINENEITYYTIEDKIFNHDELYTLNDKNFTLTFSYPFKDFYFNMELIPTRAQSRNTFLKMNPKCVSCFLTSHYNSMTSALIRNFVVNPKAKNNKVETLKDILSSYLPINISPICKPCSFKESVIQFNPKNGQFFPCKSSYVKKVSIGVHVYDSYIKPKDTSSSLISSINSSTSSPGGAFFLSVGNSKSTYNRTNHNWDFMLNPNTGSMEFTRVEVSELFPYYSEWIANKSVDKYITKLPYSFSIHRCSDCGLISFGARNNSFLSWVPSIRLNASDELEKKIFANIRDNITNPKILYFLGE